MALYVCTAIRIENPHHAQIQRIFTHYRPNALVDPRDVMTVNLWMGGKPTATTLHYDSNHNLLVVLRGAKQVQLFPPSATPALEAGRAYSASANHSTLTVPAEAHDLFQAPRIENCQLEPWLARLEAGDALFLPQGWWHQVDSGTRTVALNYWVAGFVEQVLDGGRHRKDQEGEGERDGGAGEDGEDGDDEMLPFYLRAVLQRAVERERKRMVEAAVRKALAGGWRVGSRRVVYFGGWVDRSRQSNHHQTKPTPQTRRMPAGAGLRRRGGRALRRGLAPAGRQGLRALPHRPGPRDRPGAAADAGGAVRHALYGAAGRAPAGRGGAGA